MMLQEMKKKKKQLLVIKLLLVAGSSEKNRKQNRETESNLFPLIHFKCLAKTNNTQKEHTHAERKQILSLVDA